MTCELKFRLVLNWWLSFVAFACAVSCGAAPAYDKAEGVIQGTALDAVTRQPIARVKVSSDSTHYTYTAADGTYTLNTSVSADTARRDPPTLEERVRSLIAEFNPDAITENSAKPAASATDPTEITVTYKKLGYYQTLTKNVANGAKDVDVEMNPSEPCAGLEMHPFLYAGEFQNQNGDYFDNQRVYLVMDGKVVWTYSATKASVRGRLVELGDVSMTANGNIVMSLGWGGAREIVPDFKNPADSKIVWSCSADEQIHTAQPVRADKIFVIDNSKRPKARLYDQTIGTVRAWDLPTVSSDAHGMFRHCRLLADGNLLIAHMNMAQVVEYDSANMSPIWTCRNMPNAWAAVRLQNGDTLISGNENKWVREVNPQGQIVWEFSKSDLPAGSEINLGNIQECDRLANGNTVICTWQGDPSVLEVTPEKRIVWALPKKLLGNSSSIQLLDEPGAMEDGNLQR
jgi:outer membrane protein assembly factor BamB